MKFFSGLFSLRKPAPPARRVLDGVQVKALLLETFKGGFAPNYRHITQKERLAVCRMEDIADAAAKVYMPWRKDAWECEDQARAVLNECQRRAANEGCSWACGVLRADNGAIGDIERQLHVWLWAVVEKPGMARFPESRVLCYDATGRKWADLRDINYVDYTLT